MPETGHLGRSKQFFLLLFFLLNSFLTAQVYPDKKVDALLQKGIGYLVYEDYKNASRVFDEMKQQFPKLPLGWMYGATTEFCKANDYYIPLDEKRLLKDLDYAIDMCKGLINNQPNNPWFHYFLGLAKGFKAVYQTQDGNWLGAISTGLSTLSAFEKCLDLDSNFTEAYVGVGTYQYWKGDKLGFLEWIPFVGGNKQGGIPLIKKAMQSFCYNEYSAMVTLFWIYMNEKDYKNARLLAEKGLQKYPGSIMFKKIYARALEELEPWKAINLYSEFLEDYRKQKIANRCHEIFYKYSLASTYRKKGDTKQAISICNEILAMWPLSQFEQDRVGEKYEKAKKLKVTLTGK